jgi:hypothetical protein
LNGRRLQGYSPLGARQPHGVIGGVPSQLAQLRELRSQLCPLGLTRCQSNGIARPAKVSILKIEDVDVARKTIAPVVLVLSTVLGCSCFREHQYTRGPETWLSVNVAGPHRLSPRSRDTLREVDLDRQYDRDPAGARLALEQQFSGQPRRDWAYALAEMSLCAGHQAECGRRLDCAEHYYRSIQYAYAYLFAPEIVEPLNPFDPRTRLACDLYNESLARLIDWTQRMGAFDPQRRFVAPLEHGSFNWPVVQRGFPWSRDEIDSLEPALQAQKGELGRDVRGYGLGVPMVGVRIKPDVCAPCDRYLTKKHPFAVTVLLRPDVTKLFASASVRQAPAACELSQVADQLQKRVAEHEASMEQDSREPGPFRLLGAAFEGPTIELIDPLNVPYVTVNDRKAHLEAELSSPIVYALRQANRKAIELVGFLDPGRAAREEGLVMLQPYQKGKIPVVFVHGLLSDPLTWTEMFNELGADPAIRNKYQFWAFFYPTGDPFLESAAALRESLKKVRANCDPRGEDPALDQMVLVGHSMGGLLSKLQVTAGGDDYWRTLSKKTFNEIKAPEDVRDKVRPAFFFEPQPFIRQVVCIGTPHRGSSYGDAAVGRFFSWLVHVPKMALGMQQELLKDNPGAFEPLFANHFPTSVDFLKAESPVLQVLYSRESPQARFHSIVGNAVHMGREGMGDGIVPVSSAHLPAAVSEILIPEIHTKIHRHPRAVLEVKRILREHAEEFATGAESGRLIPASAQRRDNRPDIVAPAGN